MGSIYWFQRFKDENLKVNFRNERYVKIEIYTRLSHKLLFLHYFVWSAYFVIHFHACILIGYDSKTPLGNHFWIDVMHIFMKEYRKYLCTFSEIYS